MPAVDHYAYEQELERLQYTLQYVRKSLEDTISKKMSLDSEVDRLKKHFNSESSQNYIDLLINTTLQDSVNLKLKNLHTAVDKPYFARIDFREEGKEAGEKLYIGKMSLSRDEDQEMIIIDWRAPVSNLYYEERLGEAAYTSPQGLINGELLLKRQYSIEKGVLKEIFDIDIATNDEFLQSSLGANADNRLKDIVSTIQTEQNKIIRADMWKPLIVQGAAGSGKTTIALHRIAYLIYTYEKSFQPENFMIIAPNRLFLNYISDVLPELGVEKVRQTTFEDFAMEIIGKKFKMRDSNEKLIAFVDENNTEEQNNKNDLLKKTSRLKASMLFKRIIDEYMTMIEENFIPKEHLMLDTQVIFEYKEIRRLFLQEYKRLPMFKRINEIKKHLTNRLKVRKSILVQRIEDKCYSEISRLKDDMPETEQRQQLIIAQIDQKDALINNIEKHAKKAVDIYIKKISKISTYEYYKDLYCNTKVFKRCFAGKGLSKSLAIFIREYMIDHFDNGYVELEDLAPMIYIKYSIYGMDEKIQVKHIVIDEAQDFSVFQFYVLKKIIMDSSFTILGDLCQGIHSYRGTNDWERVRKYAFGETDTKYLTLEQSYRTTVEIMEAANKVIEKLKDQNLPLAKPVIRHGEKVEIIKCQNMHEIVKDMKLKIHKYKKSDFNSIAIICKTMEECKSLKVQFKDSDINPPIITGNEKEYKGGLVIVPSYLAKGLEFDVVIIANADNHNYRMDELDIKLLYVTMTRPLHILDIYYHGQISPLLQ